ncbi:MAG: alpha/beta hydrolase [Nocardia sp.]|nr:alpha/beta hydrolase [Nocardia sp.]
MNSRRNRIGLQTGIGSLTGGYRATLRSRGYRSAHFNRVRDPEVIPVTTADGARLRVHAYGPADGDVIVFVHGWSCCLEYWNPQIHAFARDHRVVVFDQRGHGASTVGRRRFDAEQLADDLADVLAAAVPLGRKAVLVGHSMGGMSVQAWAKYHPEQVERYARAALLLNTSSGAIASESLVLPLFNDVIPAPAWLSRGIFGQPVPFPNMSMVRKIFKARIANPYATEEQIDFGLSIVRSCRPLVRGRFAVTLIDTDIHGAATALRVPTSVVAGSYDKLLPEPMSRRIADDLASIGCLDNYSVLATGHLGNIEATEEVNAELTRLIEATGGGRSAMAG